MVAENPTLLTSTPDGIELAWISADRKVVYWDTARVSAAEDIAASEAPITGLVINPKKTSLAYSTYKGDVYIWGIDAKKATNSWKKDSWLSDLSFSPDGQYLAGVDLANFTASIYTQDGQIFKQLVWNDSVYPSLTGAFFSPDWKKIAWVAQSAVQIMDGATGEKTFLLSHSDVVSSIAWAPDSKLIATTSTIAQGSDIIAAVLVWDSDTGKLFQTIPQNSPVQGISFAPDIKSLAVLDISGQLHVWQLSQ
jgi:WD40 repeat protein